MSNAATGRVAAIIPAAGSGVRFGADLPKAFVELEGISLLTRSAHAMSVVADVIAVAVPNDQLQLASRHLAEVDAQIHIVAGGIQRQDSIANALAILPEEVELILVHDAARPLIPIDVINRVVNKLRSGHVAVIPVLQMVDTVKVVDSKNNVIETIDRNQLRRVQTPQGFTREVLVKAYSDVTTIATDDAGLMESIGIQITCVDGDELAMKITTSHDFEIASALLGAVR